jgi:hypothetical protein
MKQDPAEQIIQKIRLPKALVSIPSPPADPSEGNFRDKFMALVLENEAIQNQMSEVLTWVLDNFRGRYPLKETSLSYLDLPPVDEQFALHPELAEFMNISTDEQFLMEDAFNFTRGTLRVLQEQNLAVTSPTPAQVMMTFSNFPEEGLALREDLYAALEASLGSERLERLLTVSEDQLDAAFDYFGQATRTLIFEIILDEADNELKVVVNDGWFHEESADQVVYTESESVVSSLPLQYSDFQYLLPESFTPFMQVQ